MGAATGFYVAARHPQRIAKLVACDGPPSSAPGGQAAWDERIALAQSGGMAMLVEPTIARWFTPASIAANLPAVSKVRAMIAATPIGGLISCARALQSYDISAELPGLALPVLLVAGEKDGALPATLQAVAARIPNARYAESPRPAICRTWSSLLPSWPRWSRSWRSEA